jgi:3-methyladenine DNA glycosylase/8-oxoguanine DNA glycosylase
MFLIFRLRRLNVWPTGDFGVRQGYGLAWKVPMPTAGELEPLGDPYRPTARSSPGIAGARSSSTQALPIAL